MDNQLLNNEDVQKVVDLVTGFINGTKKLVIESKCIYRTSQSIAPEGYKHTFRVEDVNGRT